jgi:hypothetical protein
MLSEFYDEKANDVYFYIGGLEDEINNYIDLDNIEDYYNNEEYTDDYYEELADYYDSYYDDYNDY